MDSIPLSDFVDFVLTSGVGRLTSVRQLKRRRAEPFVDFYAPLREAIVDMHRTGAGTELLDVLLSTLVDPREKQIFPKIVSGYKRFLRQGRMTWFEPPARDWPLGPTSVRVNPEVGLLIDGRPHVIKLYFQGDPLSAQRTIVTNTILTSALQAMWPGTVVSVLDVRRAKLYPHRPKGEIDLLLKAEAASLASLWSDL